MHDVPGPTPASTDQSRADIETARSTTITHIDLRDLGDALPDSDSVIPPAATRQDATTISCACWIEDNKTIVDFSFPNLSEGLRLEVPYLLDAKQCESMVELFIRDCMSGRGPVRFLAE